MDGLILSLAEFDQLIGECGDALPAQAVGPALKASRAVATLLDERDALRVELDLVRKTERKRESARDSAYKAMCTLEVERAALRKRVADLLRLIDLRATEPEICAHCGEGFCDARLPRD